MYCVRMNLFVLQLVTNLQQYNDSTHVAYIYSTGAYYNENVTKQY
jgi:hypothetical protein